MGHQSCPTCCLCRISASCHQRRTVASWAQRPAGCHPPCTPPSTGPPAPGMALGPCPHPGGRFGDMGGLSGGIWDIKGEQEWGRGGEQGRGVVGAGDVLGGTWLGGQAVGAACITCPLPRTPGSLEPSIPIPTTLRPLWKREAPAHPPEPALMGIYPTDGTGGPHQPPSTPSQSSSPARWAESGGSEGGPDGNSSE